MSIRTIIVNKFLKLLSKSLLDLWVIFAVLDHLRNSHLLINCSLVSKYLFTCYLLTDSKCVTLLLCAEQARANCSTKADRVYRTLCWWGMMLDSICGATQHLPVKPVCSMRPLGIWSTHRRKVVVLHFVLNKYPDTNSVQTQLWVVSKESCLTASSLQAPRHVTTEKREWRSY